MTFTASRPGLGVLWLATAMLWLGPLARPSSAGFSLSLDFSQTNALPSAAGQGLTYAGSPGVSETDVFQVSGGSLRVDTLWASGDIGGYYQLSPGYDHNSDTELEFRARVSATSGSFGLVIGFADVGAYGYVVVTPTGWRLDGSPASGTFSDPSAFHTFNLTVEGVTKAYTLRIDGSVASTGTLPTGSANPSALFIGDITPTGGNLRAEISSIHYSNGTTAVAPEPSTAAMFGSGLLATLGYAACRGVGQRLPRDQGSRRRPDPC